MTSEASQSVIGTRPSVSALIGGRYAVSWQGYLVVWPFSVLLIMTTAPAFAPPNQWLTGVLVSTAAYAATGVILWLASVTILRNRAQHPAPIVLVAVIGGVAWMARSAVVKFYLETQDLPSLAPLGERLIFGFFLGAVTVPITAWMIASFAAFSIQRRQLVDELVHEEIKTQRLATYVEVMRQGIVDRVQQRVATSREAVRWPDSEDDTAPVRGIQALDSLSQEAGRELSSNLWQQARQSARVNPLSVIRSSAMTKPFNYWVLIVMFVFSLPSHTRTWSIDVVLSIIVPTFTYVLIVSIIANRLAPRLSPRAAVVSYAIAIGLLFASGFVAQIAVGIVGIADSGGQSLVWLASLSFGIFYPLGGSLTRIGAVRENTLDRLRDSISQQEVLTATLQREDERIRREIATALHGSWNANLTAASMRLQQAIDNGDKQAASQALLEARNLIDIDIASFAQRKASELDDSLATLADAWQGLVEITTRVNITSEVTATLLSTIEDVVTEGINNAVRHGDASRIDVTVDGDQSTITITVIDNGTPAQNPTPGLGSRFLDSVAPGSWSRVPNDRNDGSGTVLTVQLRTASTLN